MRERTRTWRFPPCPPYDVEGTESWLCDMAFQGWMLEKDGTFFGVASFEKKKPAEVRYRLEAAPKQAGDWDDNGGMPDEEALEMNAGYGWEYVARRGQFYIYRNDSPGAREINTDPQVQALALKALQNRHLGSLCRNIFWLLFYLLLHIWKGFSPLLALAEAGLPIMALSAAVPLWFVFDSVCEAVHLQRLKKKLKAGVPLDHTKDWKRGYKAYWVKRVLGLLLISTWVLLLFRSWNDSVTEVNKRELADYEGDPPFATMIDFAEGSYEEDWKDLRFDYVSQWSNEVLHSGIKWAEHATIRRPDGSALQGGLYITYYHTKGEWLAKALASEYQRYDRAKAGKEYVPLDCPDFGLDSAAAYSDPHFPTVILRQGNVVIRAYFYQTGSGEQMLLEEWAGILADSIR